mmetsp:Transcript_21505/g.19072  ORF Transcript_21505/g.19072 Transcript_21505/m.19072 type:complete len:96 (+) Transcript_21505:200-487(+)
MRGTSKDTISKESDKIDLTNDHYEKIFKTWLKVYINENLMLKLSSTERKMFILDSKKISERISPDIQGNMTNSVMYSGERIMEHYKMYLKSTSKS